MDQQAITQRNQHQSPLLRLPAELRIKIYELAIGGHEVRVVCKWGHAGRMLSLHSQPAPDPNSNYTGPLVTHPLEATCRQVRKETVGMFYEFNTFQGNPSDVVEIAERVAARGCCIRSVRIPLESDDVMTDTWVLRRQMKTSSLQRSLEGLPGLWRILIHLDATVLHAATAEEVMATVTEGMTATGRYKQSVGRQAQDIELTVYFDNTAS